MARGLLRVKRVRRPRAKGSIVKGMAAGALGGLAASYAMTLFLRVLDALGLDPHPHHPQHSVERGDRDAAHEEHEGGSDDAPVELVERIANACGIELSTRAKELASPLVHYAFGTTMGAVYGALAARNKGVTAGMGLAFGALVWLLFDEIAIPALRLSPPPSRTPLPVHLRAAAAHVVYGPGTELGRRLVSAAWQ
jgi:putative membrane protein